MATNTRFGRTTTAAAIAGLVSLAVTLAVASSLLISAVFGAGGSGLVPGYDDYGQRHRAEYAVQLGAGSRLDDYGIRCVVVGWCSMPAGVPQPAGISPTH